MDSRNDFGHRQVERRIGDRDLSEPRAALVQFHHILSSQDYSAQVAERFGMVTRALPDKELDAFVETLITRLSGFDKQAHACAEYIQSLAWPGFAARRPRMGKLAAEHGPAELERRLGQDRKSVV